MKKSLIWAMAFGLAILLPPHIASLLPPLGVYSVQGISIIPPTHAEASTALIEATTTYQAVSLTAIQVRAYVKKIASEKGVNPQKALWIIDHESSDCWRNGFFQPDIAGPEPDGSTSYGCWQFNDKNPDFNMAVATNFASSTEIAMDWILEGNINKWSTYAYCRLWFKDCPF